MKVHRYGCNLWLSFHVRIPVTAGILIRNSQLMPTVTLPCCMPRYVPFLMCWGFSLYPCRFLHTSLIRSNTQDNLEPPLERRCRWLCLCSTLFQDASTARTSKLLSVPCSCGTMSECRALTSMHHLAAMTYAPPHHRCLVLLSSDVIPATADTLCR